MANRIEIINGIRAMLDWLESHEEVPIPNGFEDIQIYPDGKENLLKVARAMGSFKKSSDESFFHVTKDFGSIKVRASEWRNQVCTRKQVGIRKIEERVPTAYEIQEKEVPVYEYECPETLLGKGD